MPKIVNRCPFDGAEARVERLGLRQLWSELESILTDWPLLVEERRDANSGASVRAAIDARFAEAGSWKKIASGGIDWVKCHTVNGTRVCIGVEIQFSARSDLLIVDIDHLRQEITAGSIDIGVVVVPSDHFAFFLTDRAPHFSAACKAVERARANDLPLMILGLDHDGTGEALAKRRTRQGRLPQQER
jgi:hypothetical protein